MLLCVAEQVVVSAPAVPLTAHSAAPAGGGSGAAVAITGGSGGLGLLMAQWLAASGAVRHITLIRQAGEAAWSCLTARPHLFEPGSCCSRQQQRQPLTWQLVAEQQRLSYSDCCRCRCQRRCTWGALWLRVQQSPAVTP